MIRLLRLLHLLGGSTSLEPGRLAALAASALLAACAQVGQDPPGGPPDLDDSSAAAPKCQEQVYPGNSRLRSNQGLVVVRAQVGADGIVRDVQLVSSTTHDNELDTASLQAARKCKFAPAPTAASGTSDAVRPVDIMVSWELLPNFGAADRGIVRIGIRKGSTP
jgi:TonB family protein